MSPRSCRKWYSAQRHNLKQGSALKWPENIWIASVTCFITDSPSKCHPRTASAHCKAECCERLLIESDNHPLFAPGGGVFVPAADSNFKRYTSHLCVDTRQLAGRLIIKGKELMYLTFFLLFDPWSEFAQLEERSYFIIIKEKKHMPYSNINFKPFKITFCTLIQTSQVTKETGVRSLCKCVKHQFSSWL